jgi:outer membrane protease
MTHNEAGIALYRRRRFEIEGIKKHSLLVGSQYVDEYYMARLLEKKQEMNDVLEKYYVLMDCELYHITLRCLINAHTL